MPNGTPRTEPRRIQSRQNPRVKELRSALTRTGRTAGGLLALEGEHLIAEALCSGLRFDTLFLRDGYTPEAGLPADADRLVLPSDIFASAVATEQPQGIAALVHPPVFSRESLFAVPGADAASLLLVLAGLQDPGNVGTLLRSAEAFAATGVLLLPGTASPWNPKTLRASAGSAFRVPTLHVTEVECVTLLKQQDIAAVAAVSRDGKAIDTAGLDRPSALLIGNEGAGLSLEFIAAANALRVTIPMPGAVESLNAAIAGSLLLYEATKSRGSQRIRRF